MFYCPVFMFVSIVMSCLSVKTEQMVSVRDSDYPECDCPLFVTFCK